MLRPQIHRLQTFLYPPKGFLGILRFFGSDYGKPRFVVACGNYFNG